MFFSKGVEDELSDKLSNLIGFQKVHNLGTYLGMPLFHDRAICSTVRFVVEKVRRKLNNWDAKQLQWQVESP